MLLLIKEGAVVATALGARPKQALAEALELDDHVAA
jgi:hypothetical protein